MGNSVDGESLKNGPRVGREVSDRMTISAHDSCVLQRNDNAKILVNSCNIFQSRGGTYLLTLATEITSTAFPGAEEYHDPEAPSLPAAMVTIIPWLAIRLATTALEEVDQPSAPPRERVRISFPSLTPRRRASTITVRERKSEHLKQKSQFEMLTLFSSGAIATENTVTRQKGVRSNTKHAIGIARLSSDSSSDVGSVAVTVLRIVIGNGLIGTVIGVSSKIVTGENEFSGADASSESGMSVVNTSVDTGILSERRDKNKEPKNVHSDLDTLSRDTLAMKLVNTSHDVG